jgi:hypothetical protein
MGFRSFCMAFAVCTVTFAQLPLSIPKLVEAVRSSIAQKNSDKDVAAFLATVRLTNRLDDRTIEELQALGAGVRTIAALKKLAESSAKLPVATDASAQTASDPGYVPPPGPGDEEQRRILAAVREYALNYSKTLPDFICLQLTNRAVDSHYQPGGAGSWTPSGQIVERLSYFDRQEKYEPVAIDGKSVFGKVWESIGGTKSRGEFGSLLREVFEPETEASFQWDHWGRWDNDLCYVFRYRVEQGRSRYSVDYEGKEKAVPGYHGLVYVLEKEPYAVIRLTIEPEMEAGFPIQEIHQAVNYKAAEISGHQYLLPANSTVLSRAGNRGSRNDIEFRMYQKYAADAKITFDAADDGAEPKSPAQKKP